MACWAGVEALPLQVCPGPASAGPPSVAGGASPFSSLPSYLYPPKSNTARSTL